MINQIKKSHIPEIPQSSNLNRVNLIKSQLKQAPTGKNVPALLKFTPSPTESLTSGGTSHILPEERKKASFSVEEMIIILNGGKENTKKRKFVESVISKDPEDQHRIYNYDREETLKHSLKEFIRIHKPFKNFKPTREDIMFMSQIALSTGALNNSHAIFVATVIGQANEEQFAYWVPKIMNFEITGSYAQTELGHGSNVRGLQTQAVYDKGTDEFVLSTPTLQSIKWWPGCLGKIATHCVLYAQLIIDGKEHGVQVFIVQIRDENHLPLKGIRLGDLGNKMGDGGNDTGFMIMEDVRIPRDYMLMKYRRVTQKGKFEDVIKADAKVHYTTMMTTRATMVHTAAARLAYASTIAVRYSCVRQQGFVDLNAKSYKDKEYKIIDYKIQQYRVLKQLSTAYAMKFTGLWMIDQITQLEGKQLGIIKNTDLLKELAATSAGLKSLTTLLATNGLEECRKCCGGNGYLMSSGIAAASVDYLWQVTAEGDAMILALLTAKHLLKSIGKLFGGYKLQGILDYFNIIAEPEFDLNNLRPHNAKSASDYHNLNYLFSFFKYRSIERNLSVAKSFNELITEKEMGFLEAFNQLGYDMILATHSHCYYIIMLNFIQKIKETTDEKIQKVLTKLCVLYACCNLLDDNWGDTIQDSQFKVIRSVVYTLLGEIRPDAVPLVDSFDFGDNVLRSAIGRYDGNVYEALFDSAQKSVLNQKDPFDGYEEYLKPHLNKELLKKGNKPYLKNSF
jgi:acyl-CoA oxidase